MAVLPTDEVLDEPSSCMPHTRSLTLAVVCAVLLSAAFSAHGQGEADGTRMSAPKPGAASLDPMDPDNWEIGPIMNGQMRSWNMPLHPSRHPEGWAIEFPYPSQNIGSVHYVTMPTGSLSGKSRIVMEYRVETQDARLVPRWFPDKRGTMTLYFQRAGDDWSRDFEAYRWYAAAMTHEPQPGAAAIEARLDRGWISMTGIACERNRTGFDAALAEAWRVGFVLGGGDGLGHGAYATGPFRLIVTSFRIE
ncbi:MAG TPA: hypothetical protein VF522_01060 [Ramlibacter sp.]|uniref:hypothetical protein n=1 Tax=Ramlibacter sp. TaxID=1917967 RepID=UPI002ED62035